MQELSSFPPAEEKRALLLQFIEKIMINDIRCASMYQRIQLKELHVSATSFIASCEQAPSTSNVSISLSFGIDQGNLYSHAREWTRFVSLPSWRAIERVEEGGREEQFMYNRDDEKLSLSENAIYNNFRLFNQSDRQVTLILITWNQWNKCAWMGSQAITF